MAKKFRVGIIGDTGHGDYGHAVDVAFTKIENVEIVALADPSEAGRAAAQKRTGAKTIYASYKEMLEKEKLDIVGICPRWIDQHKDMLLASAAAGCHVYMEKPFCPDLRGCDEVIKQLDSKHLKLNIAHITQYSPVLEVVKKILQDGTIGDVLELRARGKEDARGGGEDLWVLGSHTFGIMRSLVGASALNCHATMMQGGDLVKKAHVKAGAEGMGLLAGDQVQARYQFPKGVFGFFASRKGMASKITRFAVQVFGSKGMIEMESGYGVKAQILRDGAWSPGRSNINWEPITSAGIGKPEPRKDGDYQGGHMAGINDLIDCIGTEKKTKCSAEDATAIIEMIAAVFESHRVGNTVELPLKTRVNPLGLMN